MAIEPDVVLTEPSAPAGVMVVGTNVRMLKLLDAIARVAASDASVLVTGESGVGKGLVARWIHAQSSRAYHPFIAVNCAVLDEAQLESELFGSVPAGMSAVPARSGQLQAAHRGTIFLDDIADMSLRLQAMLLRFLESRELPGSRTNGIGTHVDVRVVAAASRNLSELVAVGEFREDLLYRLRVIPLEVPPLRSRRDDVPALVTHFLERIRPGVSVTPDAMQLLVRYRWPGNVRELQSVVERAATIAGAANSIDVEHLPATLRAMADSALHVHDRRSTVSDELYDALVGAGYSFWDHIYPLFLSRDITRHDVRTLVRRGLATTRGNYRALLKLFGMPPEDYKRFLNFLAAHQCSVDFREYRTAFADVVRRPRATGGSVAHAEGTQHQGLRNF